MKNVLDYIYEWSKKLPDWSCDAVRRLSVKGHLDDVDRHEILEVLKAANGMATVGKGPIPTPKRMSKGDFSAPSDMAPRVALISISEQKNVNALVEGQKIQFAQDGITLIYGDNASGKSGYSRVLKKACRSREEQEPVLPNLLDSSKRDLEPEALFDVEINGKAKQVKWVNGQDPPSELSQIAVFDSKCTRIFTDEANPPEYLPYGLDMFPALAELFQWLKVQLKQELESLDFALTFLSEEEKKSSSAKILESLKHNSDLSDFAQKMKLSTDETAKLEKLENTLMTLKLKNPVKMAEETKRRRLRMSTLKETLESINKGLSGDVEKRAHEQHSNVLVTEEAARLAYAKAFKDEPLPGVGSVPWRLMFDAAKRFSTEEAYPNLDFPVTSEGSRCLLCQQVLTEEAGNRLLRFEEFIRRDLETKAKEAEAVFDATKIALDKMGALFNIDKAVLDEIEEIDAELPQTIVSFLEAAKLRWNTIVSACKSKSWIELPPMLESCSSKLGNVISKLDKEVLDLRRIASSLNTDKLRNDYVELSTRRTIVENLATVKAFVGKLKAKNALENCIEQCNTVGISRESSRISTEVITEELRDALQSELRLLGFTSVQLEIKKTAEAGIPRHRLIMRDSYSKAPLSAVLSEGEQRVVAIASFLAELRLSSKSCGIVFDDPVCSLDHIYRTRVAERLAEEAKTRQVIIFTHDIYFFVHIYDFAKSSGLSIETQIIRRNRNEIGICDTDYPWQLASTKKRVGNLKDRLQKATSLSKKNGGEEYSSYIKDCYGLLRETWERAIEDSLFNDAVLRFRKGIETQRLVCVEVEDCDFVAINKGMKRSSELMRGHDEAGGAMNPPPSPEDFERDLRDLTDFAERVAERKKKVESRRKGK